MGAPLAGPGGVERVEGGKHDTHLARFSPPRGDVSMVALSCGWWRVWVWAHLLSEKWGARKGYFMGVPLLCIPSN